jgi:hypothetical protein
MAKGYYNPKTFHNGQALKQAIEVEQFRDQMKERDAAIDKLSEKERKNYYNQLGDSQDNGEPDEGTLKEWAASDKAFDDAVKKQVIDGLEINKDYTGLRKTGLKKGGKVKAKAKAAAPKKFSRGGGIEVRGKTKGRFV